MMANPVDSLEIHKIDIGAFDLCHFEGDPRRDVVDAIDRLEFGHIDERGKRSLVLERVPGVRDGIIPR